MRKPLKYQIMLPIAGVMLTTVVVLSTLSAWLAGTRARGQIEDQLRGISETLSRSTFPLTDAVLAQMKGLSGAEFAVSHDGQAMLAASGELRVPPDGLRWPVIRSPEAIALDRRLRVNGEPHFHVALRLHRPAELPQADVLHVFYPEARYRQAWKEAVLPPLAVGCAALIAVMGLSRYAALRVTRPIDRLCDQVDRVARGHFAPAPVPQRDDELRDLSVAVNRMAEMLAEYEQGIRRHERLRTLNQLGGGMTHQLRNAVTGCRMAVDLHHRHCPARDDESLRVAVQQLERMEEYLRRFLALGRQCDRPFAPVDLGELVGHLLPLIRPEARHRDVVVAWEPPERPLRVHGDGDGLAQVVVNLLLNALEAATQHGPPRSRSPVVPRVVVRASRTSAGQIGLEVWDSGPGPDPQVQDRLFDPLVTGKRDGVGLGLSIAREIVEQHGGTIAWRRYDDGTCFSVNLPALSEEIGHVELADRR